MIFLYIYIYIGLTLCTECSNTPCGSPNNPNNPKNLTKHSLVLLNSNFLHLLEQQKQRIYGVQTEAADPAATESARSRMEEVHIYIYKGY